MLVLSKYLSAVPEFLNLVPLPSKWLWFDLARPDMIVLPVLVAGSTWLQQKLTVPASAPSSDPQSAQMQQSMTVTMPLMFGFFAMQMPAGLSIYFIVSNLVGMGVLPLQFTDGQTRKSLELDGSEAIDIEGISGGVQPGDVLSVQATASDGSVKEFKVRARLDTPNEADYWRHGGILQFVLRSLLNEG